VCDRQIADMWKQYYEQLYCAKYDNVTISAFLDKLTSLHDINNCTGLFSVADVQTAILQQKSGKAVGPDGIHIEAYKFGKHRLTVYLTLFFNSCLRCGYLPKDLMCFVFAFLVKIKLGICQMLATTEL